LASSGNWRKVGGYGSVGNKGGNPLSIASQNEDESISYQQVRTNMLMNNLSSFQNERQQNKKLNIRSMHQAIKSEKAENIVLQTIPYPFP
jgi:hypothetical protein